ncbi:hypothetical protein BC829DRAFT_426244 [Chytridium lagenaria]|nr:hypothetical protein BC829DRAFT_426244 [Chytridium lagenaria]
MNSLATLFTPRSIEALDDEHPDVAGHSHGTYKKSLSGLDLVLLGIGCIIGAGIFTLTGIVANTIAGPGVIISYVLAGYLVGASAVAVGWATTMEYTLNLVSGGKFLFDPLWSNAPVLWTESTQTFSITGSYFNVPAFLGIVLLTIILSFGIKQSSWVVICQRRQPSPFMPYGFDGAFRGSIIVFFAYIGFDAVSTPPRRPRTPSVTCHRYHRLPHRLHVIYICVCVMLCSLRPYSEIQLKALSPPPFDAGGPQWVGTLLAFGAWCAPLPTSALRPVPPFVTTLFSGFFAAVLAGAFPIDILAELSSVGTLFAFFLVSASVIVLRIREPERHRPYKIPGGKIGAFLFPSLSMAMIILLLVKGSTKETVIRVFAWMGIGLIVYFSYGFWWSKHRHPEKWPAAPVVSQVADVEAEKKPQTV